MLRSKISISKGGEVRNSTMWTSNESVLTTFLMKRANGYDIDRLQRTTLRETNRQTIRPPRVDKRTNSTATMMLEMLHDALVQTFSKWLNAWLLQTNSHSCRQNQELGFVSSPPPTSHDAQTYVCTRNGLRQFLTWKCTNHVSVSVLLQVKWLRWQHDDVQGGVQ